MPEVLTITCNASQFDEQIKQLDVKIKESAAAIEQAGPEAAEGIAVIGDTAQSTADAAQEALDGIQAPEIEAEVKVIDEDITVLQQELDAVEDKDITIQTEADVEKVEQLGYLINELKDRKINITVNADTTGLDKAKNQMAGIDAAAGGLGGNIAGQIGKGASAVAAFGAAAGISVPPVGMLAAAVNMLLSPIALITAALTLLAAIGKEVWDRLTISAEEYAESAKHASEAAQRELDKQKEQNAAADAYLSRMRELASAEQTGNSAKQETAQLLDTLQARYGDLGAVIDATTGKITNMAEVESRLNSERNKRAARAQHKVANAAMDEARGAYMKARGGGWFDGMTEAGAGRVFDLMRKNYTPEQLLRMMEEKSRNATTLDDKKNYADVADKLRKAIEARARARSLQMTGYETQEEADQAVAKKFAAATASQKALGDQQRTSATRRSDDEFADLKDLDGKKKNRQVRLQEEMQAGSQIQDQLSAAKKRLADILKEKGSVGYDAGAEADALKDVADLEKQLLQSQDRQYILKRQIAQLDKERKEAVDRLLAQTKFEIEYNQAILAGDYRKAEALKLEKELKEKNLKLTQQEKDEILAQRAAMGELALKKDLRSQSLDLLGRAMEKAGRGREFSEEKALRDAREKKGADLTDAEVEMVKKINALSWDLKEQRDVQMGDLSIKTNNLTSRGGFQSGAVLPDKDQVNRAISKNTEQTMNTVQQIERLVRELGNF